MQPHLRAIVLAASTLAIHQLSQAQVARVESFDSPGGVNQLAYSSEGNRLIVRNAGSAIKVIDLASKQVESTQIASAKFIDMDASASGRVLYAADYAGESVYGYPLGQHLIHKLDMITGQWSTANTSSIAGRIETIDDQRFLLQSTDQWIDFSVHRWGNDGTVQQVGNVASSVYSGPLVYDATHGRALHSESGISSPDVTAFKLSGDNLSKQESTSAHGYQAYELVLASDDSAVYYGARQIDPLDLTFVQRTFPEAIVAANGQYAFGSRNYYDARTGRLVGSLGGTYFAYAFSRSSTDFWAFDASTNQLVRFAVSVPEPSTWVTLALGLLAIGLVYRHRKN